MKLSKRMAALFTAVLMVVTVFTSAIPAYAASNDSEIMPLTSQGKDYKIPGSQGTLTSNAWRQTVHTPSGNTYQWDYQVSAVYSGSKSVEYIQTAWKASASLKNSASIDLGISESGASAGASSSWQQVTTVQKRWKNSNGSKSADYSSNIVVGPKSEYKQGSIYLTNTATVKLKSDPKPYSITAGV